MKTIAIIGSPRKDGNCDYLVNTLVDELDGDKDVYFLQDLDINYCKACQACQKGDCVQDDDLNKIINDLIDADLLIFSTPIYYGQITAQAKTFVDRFYQISQNQNKSLEGTKVVQIYTQANPSDSFDEYIESMKTMPFGYLGMEVVDTVIARGAMGKQDESELADAIAQIKEIGDKL